GIGRICAPVSLLVPAYMMVVMSGWTGLARVFPAALVCGVAFAGMQFIISNYGGPQLTDIIASITAIGALVLLFLVWKPKDQASSSLGMPADSQPASAERYS